MSTRAGNRNTIASAKHESHRDVATRGVRVRTHSVRLLDERISLGPGKPREANPELDFNPESARCRSHADAGLDLGVFRKRNVLAPRHEPHHSQKAGRIAGRKQLLRIGSPAVRAPVLRKYAYAHAANEYS